MLALHATQREGDVVAEAAIHIDDLGWAAYECEDLTEARKNINTGIELLKRALENETPSATRVDLIRLLVKAYRHLAGLDAKHDFEQATSSIEQGREYISELPSHLADREAAALNTGRAFVIAERLDEQYGKGATFARDKDPQYEILQSGIRDGELGREAYEGWGDAERAVKAAAIVARLYRHSERSRDAEAARARLERLKRLASRRIPGGQEKVVE
jgi:hypothetical protein